MRIKIRFYLFYITKQNISAKDIPGERFNVFAIDYGTYVHLISTAQEPKGLFADIIEDDSEIVDGEVPQNDYRSIRRVILDIEEFEKKYAQQQQLAG